MEDSAIIKLYNSRSEDAISETAKKYGQYCYYIAYNILHSVPDSEECVNDVYIKAWNSIPPATPSKLSAFLGRIARNLALNRYEYQHAKKRDTNMSAILDEAQIFSLKNTSSAGVDDSVIMKNTINSFVASLDKETRIIFVQRYWYMSPIADIAKDRRVPAGTVKSILSRTRKKFKDYLIKEGFEV